MSKTKDRITQVMLESRFGSTNLSRQDVCWIDSKFAKKGKRLTVEGSDNIWTVVEVYGSRDVEDLEMQYKAWSEFSKKLGN